MGFPTSPSVICRHGLRKMSSAGSVHKTAQTQSLPSAYWKTPAVSLTYFFSMPHTNSACSNFPHWSFLKASTLSSRMRTERFTWSSNPSLFLGIFCCDIYQVNVTPSMYRDGLLDSDPTCPSSVIANEFHVCIFVLSP